MKMAEYIMTILKSQPIVVWSWGFHCPVSVSNGLRFLVEGYLHKGWVEVLYDEGADLFNIRLLENNAVKQEETGVYLDCLVNVIDRLVETK